MPDKLMTEDEVVAQLESSMTIGIGGWGSRRKPMSLVRAIARSDLRDLTIVSYGGPDIGILCATGKVRRAVYGFVSLDSIPLEPHFRQARQQGAIEFTELDEGAFYLGLLAAAHRMPFYPTRAGLGSDMMTMNPELRTVASPYPAADGVMEEFVAIPALRLDVSLIHMNRADKGGNGQFLGPDLYFDDLFTKAADRTFMSCEKVVPTESLLDEGTFHTLKIPRLFVDGVVEAPRGAHFTECPPDYERDEAFQREYAATARDPEAWAAFLDRFVNAPSHVEYLKRVDERTAERDAERATP
jgi:glutaconate CoA-transferase subunit A